MNPFSKIRTLSTSNKAMQAEDDKKFLTKSGLSYLLQKLDLRFWKADEYIPAKNIQIEGTPLDQYISSLVARFTPAIGDIIITKSATNPNIKYPGTTWEQTMKGRVPVGVDPSDNDFKVVGATGGSKALAKHTHEASVADGDGYSMVETDGEGFLVDYGNLQKATIGKSGTHTHKVTLSEAGSGTSGNLQPYETVYYWKRTA